MRYDVYGPFWTPRFQREVTRDALNEFWASVEAAQDGLSRAVGVYVFTICFGEKLVPWYVGKTNARTGFRGELFQEHKLNHYVSSAERKRGAPAVHLIPKIEPNRGNFARASLRGGVEIDALETAMIAMALRANPDVRNSKKTWFIRNCYVPGIFGPPVRGKRPTSVATLRAALDIT